MVRERHKAATRNGVSLEEHMLVLTLPFIVRILLLEILFVSNNCCYLMSN